MLFLKYFHLLVLKDHKFWVLFPVCHSSTCVQLLVSSLMCLTCVLSPGVYGALLPCVFTARLSLLPQVLNFQRFASSVFTFSPDSSLPRLPDFWWTTCVLTPDWITIKETTYRSIRPPASTLPFFARGFTLPVRYETHCPFCGKCGAYFSKSISEPVARKKHRQSIQVIQLFFYTWMTPTWYSPSSYLLTNGR